MGSEVRFSLSASTERPHPVQGMRAGIDSGGWCLESLCDESGKRPPL